MSGHRGNPAGSGRPRDPRRQGPPPPNAARTSSPQPQVRSSSPQPQLPPQGRQAAGHTGHTGNHRAQGGLGREAMQGQAAIVWALVFFVAALIGGLAAADIVHEQSLIVVIIAVLVALIPVVLLQQGRLEGDPPPAQAPEAGTQNRGRSSDTGGFVRPALPTYNQEPPNPQGRPGGYTPTQSVTLEPPPAPEQQPGWWNNQGGAPPPAAPRGGTQPQPAVLSLHVRTDVDVTKEMVAQCPSCGSFHLNGNPNRRGWDLDCRECGHTWDWEKGKPWPPVTVRPEYRRQAR